MWTIEKVVSKGDYNYVIVRDHPNSTRHGYVLEHRVVMENHLGRLLTPEEVVHHKDGDKKNNKIENLEVMGFKEHAKLHSALQGKWYVDMICPVCHRRFTKAKNTTHLTIKSKALDTCSQRCKGKASHIKGLKTHVLQVYKVFL